jgi:hypothetical protein
MDDDDDLSEIPERFRSIVMLLLFYGKRRADIQSTIQWLCKRLKQPDKKAERQLHELLSYLKGILPGENEQGQMTSFFHDADEVNRVKTYTYTSVGGSIVMVAGCHSIDASGAYLHTNVLDPPVLSSGESEILSMSDGLIDHKNNGGKRSCDLCGARHAWSRPHRQCRVCCMIFCERCIDCPCQCEEQI